MIAYFLSLQINTVILIQNMAAQKLQLSIKTRDTTVWKKFYDGYQHVFHCFCEKNPKKKNLKALDKWYHNNVLYILTRASQVILNCFGYTYYS